MAHGLTNIDKMAYYGQLPWHGMGVNLPSLATAAEMIQAAGLDYPITQEPVRCSTGEEFTGRKLNVWEHPDGRRPIGVVGPEYVVIQNRDLFTFLDEITMDKGGPKYETAGTLWGGRFVWALARMESIDVAGDEVKPYLLASTGHEKTPLSIGLTSVRVVCNNTLTLALAEPMHKVRHSGDVAGKVSDVAQRFEFYRRRVAESAEFFNALARTVPTQAQVQDVLTRLFGDTSKGRGKAQAERVLSLAAAGLGNARHEGSAWALLNGITENETHHANAGSRRADAQDMRVNSLLLGGGSKFGIQAQDVIREVCLN